MREERSSNAVELGKNTDKVESGKGNMVLLCCLVFNLIT